MKSLGILAALSIATLANGAYAADLPMKGVVSEAAPPGWDGGYIGAHVGYGPGSLTDLGILGFFESEDGGGGPLGFSGFFAGGQAGYNWTLEDGIVFGVETALSWANETGTKTGSNSFSPTRTTKLNWTGDITAHAGIEIGSLMPYLLAGIAFANNTYSFGTTGVEVSNSASATTTQVGYTLGAGVADHLTDNLSGFVEGRYADYGIGNYTFTNNGGGPSSSLNEPASLTDWTVRTGLNWHF
jgi:outer membrane immunogenic protein